ncbi:MAG: tRNA (adenosine(37)-N6)-threonylcarbamoyltransferase complex ATPase subunit type 1 TsaE [Muribaculaceae bacterium]|nr:tRNA (adenosine(37)-N6)-threonylcarbamoyltransferase complex ATPase subunit type 1 TsaE [Muribaculaceae bacterium]MDE6197400.1 tRNA (adenosine(37)-N6)-threonylcarbamoyltransferase complex ATPase subunit type 1 TsaE [Muribaculaceae bacterium]
MKTIQVPNLEALPAAAREFASLMGDNTVFAFYGDMGAGKTTFINELCRTLGVDTDDTASPTFALINEYRSDTTAELIYHFDFYRIEDLDEALELGIEDYFDSGAICLLEWPERVAPVLPSDTVSVRIRVNDDDSRTIEISE